MYTQYGHFSDVLKVNVGQRVCMGEALGLRGNAGINANIREQSRRRRDAIHFAIYF
jgi:murein DD-endopeptidase MepM/ murein hydrolase activator NlpD